MVAAREEAEDRHELAVEPSSDSGRSKENGATSTLKHAWLTAVAVIVTGALTFLGTWISGVLEGDPGPTVSLTAGGDVPQDFVVVGEAARIDDGELWLVVDGPTGTQPNPVKVELSTPESEDEAVEFSQQLTVGGEDDVGEKYNIRAVLVPAGEEVDTGETVSSLAVSRIGPPVPEPSVTIDVTGVVEHSFVLEGWAQAIPDDRDVWIMVESGGLWFPQGDAPLTLEPAAATDRGSQWYHDVRVGQPDEDGKSFALVAVLTDKDTSGRILQRIDREGFSGIDLGDPIRSGDGTLASWPVRRTEAAPPPVEPATVAVFTNVGPQVPMEFTVTGAVANLATGDHAWIAVGTGDLLWLHGDPIVGEDRRLLPFSVPVVVGRADEVGTFWSLYVINVTADRSQQLAEWRDGAGGAGLSLSDPLLEEAEWLAAVAAIRS